MSNKSWKAKRRRKHQPAVQQAPRQPAGLLHLETIFERKTQAQIWEDLKRKHRGDVPPGEIWNLMADRRQAATTTTCSGAELARS